MQPTASRADLLLNCSWPFDPSRESGDRVSSEAARYGTEFHAEMARCLAEGCLTGVWAPSITNPHVCNSYSYLCSRLSERGYGPADRLEVEMAYAYCPRTGAGRRCEPSNEDHFYPDLQEGEIAGTADLVIVPADLGAPVYVLDHKTGHDDYSRPERLAQLHVLGLAACRVHERDEYIPAVLHTPRDGMPVLYEGGAEWATAFLNDARRRLHSAMSRVGDGSMRPGTWCGRCPVRSQCPTQHAELLTAAGELVEKANLVGSELVLVGNTNQGLSVAEKVGRLHLLLSRFRELDKAATAETKRLMAANPGLEPVRPDGKVLQLQTFVKENLSKASILRAYGKVEGAALIEKLRVAGAIEAHDVTNLTAR